MVRMHSLTTSAFKLLSLGAVIAAPVYSVSACPPRGYGRPAYYPSPVYRQPVLQYAQPVVVQAQPAVVQVAATAPTNAATTSFVENAKQSLKQRDYGTALRFINLALQREQTNSQLLQLKSLILLAQADFQPAAATAYSALTTGPVLNARAIDILYPSAEDYQRHLALLKAQMQATPDVPHLHFLMAYHQMSQGQLAEARTELTAAREKLPTDKLIPLLLAQLPAATEATAATPPPAPLTVAKDE